jgi:hypothetical protein
MAAIFAVAGGDLNAGDFISRGVARGRKILYESDVWPMNIVKT